MADNALPSEAELFMARLITLPDSVWREIVARYEWGLSDWMRIAWKTVRSGMGFRVDRLRLGKVSFEFSHVASERVEQLVKTRRLPVHLSWRIRPIVGIAVNALCARSTLAPQVFGRWYAPFEPHIPLSSLVSSSEPPSSRAAT